jgi:hypothetical protein
MGQSVTSSIAGLDYISAADSGFTATNTAANNTGIFNDLQTKVDPRKKLILPSGIIPIAGTLNRNGKLHIEGQGLNNTIIQATTNQPMMNTIGDKLNVFIGGLHGLELDGNNIAQTGIINNIEAFSKWSDIKIWNVVGTSLQVLGSLIGEFHRLEIRYGVNGIKITNRPNSDFGPEGIIDSMPNSLLFRNLSISDLSGRALEYRGGSNGAANLDISGMDIEGCGTLNGPSIVYVGGTSLGPVALGCRISGLYAERCKADTFFEYGPSAVLSNTIGSMHKLDFISVFCNSGDVNHAIKISSGNGMPNILTLDTVAMSGCGPISADGSTTKVIIQPNCILPQGKTSATNGATYIEVGGSTSGGTVPPPDTTPNATTPRNVSSDNFVFSDAQDWDLNINPNRIHTVNPGETASFNPNLIIAGGTTPTGVYYINNISGATHVFNIPNAANQYVFGARNNEGRAIVANNNTQVKLQCDVYSTYINWFVTYNDNPNF